MDAIDLAACDDVVHGHTPYVALLVKALDAWRAAKGGSGTLHKGFSRILSTPRTATPTAVPLTTAEKDQFRASVRAMRRTASNGAVIKGEEANFDEAEALAYQAYALTQVCVSYTVII